MEGGFSIMKTSEIDFPYPARRVYIACKTILHDCGQFRSIKAHDRVFRLTASKGLPIFGENLTISITATSSESCKVMMKSTDKLIFNPLKIGNNLRNVKDLDQFISNEVYRLCSPDQLRINDPEIRLSQSDIKFRN